MLVSQQDCVVVFELQRCVVNACRGSVQYLILPEADHREPPSPSELDELKERTDWLWNTVSDALVRE